MGGGIKEKTDFCAFVVSNSRLAMKEREEIFYKLCKYKKVNSGGRYLNNIGEPKGIANKLEFTKKHKFSIAFENTCHHGYTTEKLVQAFGAQTIPIYYGDECVTEIFNPKAFINCHEFRNFDEVVEYVKKIDNDDKLYNKMLFEPPLKEMKTLQDEQKRLELFLLNIFNQDKQKAFRTDKFSWGKKYNKDLKKKNLPYSYFIDKLKNITKKITK